LFHLFLGFFFFFFAIVALMLLFVSLSGPTMFLIFFSCIHASQDAAKYRDELQILAPHSLLKCSSDATTLVTLHLQFF
jgi:hypothetical protein